MPARPQQVADPPRAVADRIAPMRGGHPLIDDHRQPLAPGQGATSVAAGAALARSMSRQRLAPWYCAPAGFRRFRRFVIFRRRLVTRRWAARRSASRRRG